jgi:hypothetical protein
VQVLVKKRIKVALLPGWRDFSKENPDGPATYLRGSSERPGAFQVSCADHVSGAVPNPSRQNLVRLAGEAGDTEGTAEVIETMSGECRFGQYGSAVLRSPEYRRMQVWFLSDGYDLIMATHVCAGEPNQHELAEVQHIVENLVLVKKPWWKLW